jgi:uncharacterized protein YbbC (DUF1343 family)
MRWPETGLAFTPTSPLVRDFDAACGYPMTGLGTLIGGFTHGIGPERPFRGLGWKGKPAADLAASLNGLGLSGLKFEVATVYNREGKPGQGVAVEIADWEAWRPAELNFHLMRLACAWRSDNPFALASEAERGRFLRHVASTELWNLLARDGGKADLAPLLAKWRQQADAFQSESRAYWLYP